MNVAGPFVIGGIYNVSLIVDGKTVDTKPLRVNDDPEVVLTSVERKRMFDRRWRFTRCSRGSPRRRRRMRR